MKITKSLYVKYSECPALAWNDIFDSIVDSRDCARAKEGERVGLIARDYFQGWELYNEADPQTKPGIYAEYVFNYLDLHCRVDILIINPDQSVDIYEVKSVNDIDKDKYFEDISFQYYVVTKLGIKINSANLMSFNPDYVYDGKSYDLHQLFRISNKTKEVINHLQDVENNINALRKLDPNKCPKCPFASKCKEEGVVCRYIDRCKAMYGLPHKHSAFELYGNANKMSFINKGLLTWEDIIKSGNKLSDFNKTMINCYINNVTTPVVRNNELKEYLSKVKYPLYFFDFEGVQETIPVYPNSRPYVQIPFQYSLHISKSISDTEEDILSRHEEYLGDGINDPREELIKKMLKDLGKKGTIFVYHETYEKNRIIDLAKDFKKYKKDLEALLDRIMDLEKVFKYHPDSQLVTKIDKSGKIKKEYKGEALTTIYHPAMENSCSIKHVLPAFFPNRSDLDYHALDQVHRGDEAIEAYKRLRDLKGDDNKTLRENMYKYCCLDTKAMVVLYLKYLDLANGQISLFEL